ncbi:MAG: MATE family efflux transporter [Clostridiales bacterium]|nr:MATE family efflux transporter [Clostridiales bacterium]
MKNNPKSGYLFSNRALAALILPLILEQTLAITVGMADTMMVASVGEAGVSGVSLMDMINNLIFSVLAALATGGTVVVSQYLGANRLTDARDTSKQVVLTVFSAAAVLALLTALLRKELIRLLFGSIEADVMDAALTYLTVSAISYPFLGVYNAYAALFRAMGKTSITFYTSIVGNILNVAGNAVCIFGLHMGVLGVAIPSLLSRAVMALILYVCLKNPTHVLSIDRLSFRPDVEQIRKILYIGVPGGIENALFQGGRVLVVSIISLFGTIQIAANGVANSLDNMGCIVGQAMNLAMVAVIGRCAGTLDQGQIRYYTKKLMAFTYIATAVVNTTIIISLPFLLSLYGLSDETTVLAYKLVMIHNGFAMLLWPVSFVFPNMLRACNDVKYPMRISIFSMAAFRIGFSYVLGVRFGMGALGVWYAMILDWVFRCICFVGRYLHGDWKNTMFRLSK